VPRVFSQAPTVSAAQLSLQNLIVLRPEVFLMKPSTANHFSLGNLTRYTTFFGLLLGVLFLFLFLISSVITLKFVSRCTFKFLEFLMTLLDFVQAPGTPGGSQL